MKIKEFVRRVIAFASLAMACVGAAQADTPALMPTDNAAVTLVKTPDGGIQPQAALDSNGTLHLIYFKGKPMAGDVFYVRQKSGEDTFSAPLRVNSQTGSAIGMGTIRGAQLALGKGNRVHVAWNGSKEAQPKGAGGTPMLYTRLGEDGTAFEPQRNLITWAGGIDGGGSVAADDAGNVYVAWHAMADATVEAGRAVFLARSTDDGKTFARETKANPQPTGACACCGMKAFLAGDGTLYLMYRAAGDNVDRDTVLLNSRDKGATFESRILSKWQLGACPMTTYALTQSTPKSPVLGAWKTKEQVYFGAIQSPKEPLAKPIAAPGTGDNRKYPVVVASANGNSLFAWTEGTAWAKGGSLAWQIFDKDGKETDEKGRADGVPAWSLLTAVARPDGGFILFY